MAGVELVDGTLVVDREPNVLDELAILTGRSRATEDNDVLLERVDDETVEELVARLDEEGLWGPTMPLDRMDELLEDNIRVADEGEMVPHLEVKFVDDRFDRASLAGRIAAHIGRAELPIGPIELQIAYKLWMGSRTDFEDAVHLFTLFEECLRTVELERWVDELGVEEGYERLERA